MIKWILIPLYLFIASSDLLPQNMITFQVDMRLPLQKNRFLPQRGDSLLVYGSFNLWQGNKMILEDADGDSIYTFEFVPQDTPGTVIQYKFVIHEAGGRDIWEQNPDPSNPDYGNRRFKITGRSIRLPVAVFDLDRYLAEPEFTYNVSSLREDFLQMRDSTEALHPALYAFTDRSTFDQIFESKLADLKTPMSGAAFLRFLAPVVAKIGCGHSSIRMPENWWISQPDRFLPLQLYFTGNKVYLSSASGELQPGSEILAINEQPMQEIVEFLYTVIPADGYNRGYQRAVLNTRFPYYYGLFYGFPEMFTVRFRDHDTGSAKEVQLNCISGAELGKFTTMKMVLSLSWRNDPPVAILHINNFGYYAPEQEAYFREFTDSVFTAIKASETEQLIVDLRGNDGGNPFCAAYLLSYIAEEPVSYFSRPFGKYAPLADPVPLAENRFEGELCILIDEKCFSTTGHLAALLKYHDIGTLIGSETGGTYTCNDAKKLVVLSNTGLNLQIARGTFAVAVRDMDRSRGVIPDLQVDQKIDDLINGTDTVLEYTLDLIGD